MEIEFVLERVHIRKIFTVRAYRIFFTDTCIYFIHLGEDSSQLPVGAATGGIAGTLAQNIADKITEKSISARLKQIETEGFESVVAKDKRSFKAVYEELELFQSAAYKWNCWPSVTFGIRNRGKWKFTFDLQMEDLEEERQAIVEYMRGKRPDLVQK